MQIIFTIGQVLYGGFFVLSGISHFKNLTGMAGYAASKKVPLAKLAVAFTGVMLVLGGLGIMFNIMSAYAFLLVIVFLLGVTFVMHDFWNMQDLNMKMNNRLMFMKNVALLGAAMMLFALVW